MTTNESKAKGGHARAAKLSPEERSEIAKNAANARWAGDIPQALFEGEIGIGGQKIPAAVLPDGTRVLTQSAYLLAIGRSRTPKAGTGVLTSDVDELPFFIRADVLKPFINNDLITSTKPIHFLSKDKARRVGYNAESLPQVCEVYLKYRDSCVENHTKVKAQFKHLISACDMVIRGLAHIGILALVDEATGYQAVRDKNALQAILDKYLAKELAAWAKRFPDEFYKEMFRLKGWPFDPAKVAKPSVVGTYTNSIVYERLAPGLLQELEEKNPKGENGVRKSRHHQWLTSDVGHPALAQHLHATIAFMRLASNWDQFEDMMDRAFPVKGRTIPLLLE